MSKKFISLLILLAMTLSITAGNCSCSRENDFSVQNFPADGKKYILIYSVMDREKKRAHGTNGKQKCGKYRKKNKNSVFFPKSVSLIPHPVLPISPAKL